MVDSMILSQLQKYSLPTDFIWKFNPYFLLQQNHHYDLPTLPLKIQPLFPSPTKLSFQSANFTSGNSALIFFTNKTIIAIHQLYLWKFNPYFLLQQNYHYDLPTLPLKIQPLCPFPTKLSLQSTNFTSENSAPIVFLSGRLVLGLWASCKAWLCLHWVWFNRNRTRLYSWRTEIQVWSTKWSLSEV